MTLEVTDFGVIAARDEPRTAAVCVNAAGESRLVVASRGWVLVVDPDTGDCAQLPFPGEPEFPFASLASRTGMLWTGAGRTLHEVDPFALTLTTHHPCEDDDGEEIVGMAFVEGPDGLIWFTTYPGCRLFAIDPETGRCEQRARLSTTEQYAVHLAIDDQSRVYAGIGTEHRDVVVVTAGRSEPRSALLTGAQGKGSGFVHRGVDGRIYGHVDSDQLHPLPGATHQWYRLDAGVPTAVAADTVARSNSTGRGFGRIHVPRNPGWSVERIDLPDHELVVTDSVGARRVVPLHYESVGAGLSTFVESADRQIIGTSSHPLRFYRLDSRTGVTAELDRGTLAVAGGNVCAWARLGDQLYGVAYAGGHLYRYDPHAPASATNPQHLVGFEQVHRPRCAVAHPDRRHVIWSGYGGYGDTGGGLAIHLADGSATGHNRVIEHTDLIPHHATTALDVLADGDVIGATSVDTPGGAQPRAVTAVVYRLAWPDLEMTGRWVPHPEVQSWAGVAAARDGTVHLFSADGWHIHLDPADGTVLAREDWTADGPLARGGVVTDLDPGTDGSRVAVLQSRAIRLLNLNDHATHRHPWPHDPITAGGVLRRDVVHVACRQRLLRIRLPLAAGSGDHR